MPDTLLAGGFGILAFALLGVGLIITVVWIVFPFLVVARLNKIVKAQEETAEHLLAMRRAATGTAGVSHSASHSTPHASAPKSPPAAITADDPDIAAHLARKAARERGEH